MAARIAMMAITTSSSIKVKAPKRRDWIGRKFPNCVFGLVIIYSHKAPGSDGGSTINKRFVMWFVNPCQSPLDSRRPRPRGWVVPPLFKLALFPRQHGVFLDF